MLIAYENICWLDVPVDNILAVEVLQSTCHIICDKRHTARASITAVILVNMLQKVGKAIDQVSLPKHCKSKMMNSNMIALGRRQMALNWTTFSCCRESITFASLRNAFFESSSEEPNSFFTATCSSANLVRYTVPKPPRPIFSLQLRSSHLN